MVNHLELTRIWTFPPRPQVHAAFPKKVALCPVQQEDLHISACPGCPPGLSQTAAQVLAPEPKVALQRKPSDAHDTAALPLTEIRFSMGRFHVGERDARKTDGNCLPCSFYKRGILQTTSDITLLRKNHTALVCIEINLFLF